jgi:hypothetical protein
VQHPPVGRDRHGRAGRGAGTADGVALGPAVPGQPGRLPPSLVGAAYELREFPRAFVHPHVAHGVGVEERLHSGHIAAVVDGVRQPPVEGQDEFQVGTLLLGVLASVVVHAAVVMVVV